MVHMSPAVYSPIIEFILKILSPLFRQCDDRCKGVFKILVIKNGNDAHTFTEMINRADLLPGQGGDNGHILLLGFDRGFGDHGLDRGIQVIGNDNELDGTAGQMLIHL